MTILKNAKGERFSFAEISKVDVSKIQKEVKETKTSTKSKNEGFIKDKPHYHEVWQTSNLRRSRLAFYLKKDLNAKKEDLKNFSNLPQFGETLVLTEQAQKGLSDASILRLAEAEKLHMEAVKKYKQANK